MKYYVSVTAPQERYYDGNYTTCISTSSFHFFLQERLISCDPMANIAIAIGNAHNLIILNIIPHTKTLRRFVFMWPKFLHSFGRGERCSQLRLRYCHPSQIYRKKTTKTPAMLFFCAFGMSSKYFLSSIFFFFTVTDSLGNARRVLLR